MLPDLGGLARELSGADVLAAVQLLNRCHHGVHCIKEEGGGELQRRRGGGVRVLYNHTHTHTHAV